MYSAANRNSLIVAERPRLSRTGLPLADRLEQDVVLHVARADLQDVGVAGDQVDVLGRETSVTTARPVLVACGAQDLEALLLEALEGVGLVRGLKAPPRSATAPAAFTARRRHRLVVVLDRAGAGDDLTLVPPNELSVDPHGVAPGGPRGWPSCRG